MRRANCLGMLSVLLFISSAFAQQPSSLPSAPVTNAAVPALINFSGTLYDTKGKALAGTVGVTFALYKEDQGGAPLWIETQNVQTDRSGRYSVALGSTRSTGVPADIFVAGEARWLGVQPAGQKEIARIMLLSVPYALKAGDAQTIGGLPPSAFVLANPSPVAATSATSAPGSVPPPASNVTTSGGTVNTLPLWTTGTNIQSSALTQTGSGATAKIGVGTAAPTTTLDVHGGAAIRGVFSLPATGNATATLGKPSQPQTFVASSFSSSTLAPVNQTFRWQAEPANNNTAAPSATLNLLYGLGAATPTETGLRIGPKGIIAFAPGQTFPGGSGTITGVTAGTGLTGGGTTGTVTLNVDTTKVPLLSVANTFSQPQNFSSSAATTLTVSDTSATGRAIYGHATSSASGPAYGVVGGAEGVDGVGVWGFSNGTAGYGVQGKGATNGVLGWPIINSTIWNVYTSVGVHGDNGATNGVGVLGTEDGGYGVKGISDGTVINTAGTYGAAGPPSGFGGIAGVWGDAANHVGTFGSSVNSSGVLGESSLSTGVTAINGTKGYGIIATAAATTHEYGVGLQAESFGQGVFPGGPGSDGVRGITHTINGSGVVGINDAPGGIGVYGSAAGGGPAGFFNGNVTVTGKITSYNNDATLANGVPSIVSQFSFSSNGSGNNIYQNLYTPPSDGVFRITAFQECTATSGGGTFFSLGFNWTLPTSGGAGGAVTGPNCLALAGSSGTLVAHVKGGTPIQYNYAGMDASFQTLILIERLL